MAETFFQIRRATHGDRDALRRLGAELIRVHAGFDSRRFLPASPANERRYEAFLLEQAGAQDAVVLVAGSEQVVSGYVFAALEAESFKELRGPAGFIHDLVVAEGARGHGIGRALLTAAIEWLREQKADRVLLWTAPQNTAAQHLFRQFGFRQTMFEYTRDWPSAPGA